MNVRLLFNILYTKTVGNTKVHHLQVYADTQEEAVTAGRKEIGETPYFISVEPHNQTLNAVHPDYY